jgi:hypothetical protein
MPAGTLGVPAALVQTPPNASGDRIWATYRPGQEKSKTPSQEYLAAALEAQEWIQTNFPPQKKKGLTDA